MLMNIQKLQNYLTFIQQAEKLKSTLRSAYTSTGRQESTAEHTWRLCLMAMVLENEFIDIDFSKLIKICIIHDLGEAIHGDIPAVNQQIDHNKAIQERQDLEQLLCALEPIQQQQFLTLWDEYEHSSSLEARIVKGLDKLETIIQHNQGQNPTDFNYQFNLSYGQKYMDNHPILSAIRQLVDQETQKHITEST